MDKREPVDIIYLDLQVLLTKSHIENHWKYM